MKTLFLFSLVMLYTPIVFANTIHSSVLNYFEVKDYSGSLQKKDAIVYGLGIDVHYKDSSYKVNYESAQADTKQPPLKKDLNYQKIFFKYGYKLNDRFKFNINYANILHDNIAITDDGKVYGAGLTYTFNKQSSMNVTQFYTDYDDFNVYQSDLNVYYKIKINDIKFNLSSMIKYIDIDEENQNSFLKNADNSYLTSGIKLHSHYKTYHFGAGAYFGKRAFAVMNDGFKVQHHAMEFNSTYAIGVGKNIGDFVVRLQYIDQRATEMPLNNKDVKIKVFRLIANYKF
ncbi:MAG: hypothetical protein KAI02_03915 [Gammaproteobacteria bacterium]|nr:hypothetical protein [Gammaproteobacteria bacterium]